MGILPAPAPPPWASVSHALHTADRVYDISSRALSSSRSSRCCLVRRRALVPVCAMLSAHKRQVLEPRQALAGCALMGMACIPGKFSLLRTDRDHGQPDDRTELERYGGFGWCDDSYCKTTSCKRSGSGIHSPASLELPSAGASNPPAMRDAKACTMPDRMGYALHPRWGTRSATCAPTVRGSLVAPPPSTLSFHRCCRDGLRLAKKMDAPLIDQEEDSRILRGRRLRQTARVGVFSTCMISM